MTFGRKAFLLILGVDILLLKTLLIFAEVLNDAFIVLASVYVLVWVKNLNTSGVSFLKGSESLKMLLLTILILEAWFIFTKLYKFK